MIDRSPGAVNATAKAVACGIAGPFLQVLQSQLPIEAG